MKQLNNPHLVACFLFVAMFGPLWANERPNIILLMGDDHGWEETGYNGHLHVQTPVLDEMAATGFRLDRFYAAHPSCSPTRASFLTGRHSSITDADYQGARAIFDGHFKLVVHEHEDGPVQCELFDLTADPAETTNLLDQQTALADQLQSKLRDWQQSVLTSLTGANY